MRRRQMAAQSAVLPLPPYEPSNWSNVYVDRTDKGVCRKCGKYVGKGVGPHQRFCKK